MSVGDYPKYSANLHNPTAIRGSLIGIVFVKHSLSYDVKQIGLSRKFFAAPFHVLSFEMLALMKCEINRLVSDRADYLNHNDNNVSDHFVSYKTLFGC